MNKIKLIVIFVSILYILPNKTKALCSDTEVVRLSNLAKNVQYSYTYDDSKKEYYITFTNLTSEIVLEDFYTDKTYIKNGEITITEKLPGSYKYNIYSNNKCTTDILSTKYIQIPFLNRYKDNALCKGIEEYAYCSKWLKNDITYETWYEKVTEYKKTKEEELKKAVVNNKNILDQIREFYINYYYIMLPIIVAVLILIIYIKNKRDLMV